MAESLAKRLPLPTVLRTTLASGLELPTDLAFLPDGTLLFTQSRRGLFMQRKGEASARRLLAANEAASDAGAVEMLALAIDPDHGRNQFLYVYLRSNRSDGQTHRVIRLSADLSAARVVEQHEPLRVSLQAVPGGDGNARPGAGLRFGPDGYLYVGIEDGAAPEAAQSKQTLAGKVLRIDREGKPAPGNHAGEGVDSRVHTLGVRNPVALAFHPNSEALLVADRRAAQPDEITLARPGSNAGWDPQCTPPKRGYCEHMAEQRSAPRALGTVTGWRGVKPGEGLAAMEPLRGESWGPWRNGFVVAFDRAQRLDLLKFDAQGRVVHSITALERAGVGFRAVAQGPDGLYVATSGKPGGDEIWRLSVR